MATIFKLNPLLGSTLTTGPNPSYEVSWEAFGETDRLQVEADARSSLDADYDGMPIQRVDVEEFGGDSDERWKVTVLYANDGYVAGSFPAEAETGSSSFSFDTGGGTQHITQSLQTVFADSLGAEPVPDFDGAIGATKDGIEGVDITVPVFKFKETHYIDDTLMTTAYKKLIAKNTGRVNDATFRDYPAGEVLFLGAQGHKRDNKSDWEIVFNFAQSDNRDDLVVGSFTGVVKQGWHHIWVRYEDTVDAGGAAMVKKVVNYFVEKVYESGTFTELGI